MAHALFGDLPTLAKDGAGFLFQTFVRRLYRTLTGEAAKGHPVRLLERLMDDERLTPEAALHLLAWARALTDAGLLPRAQGVRPVDWRERVEALGRRLFN